MANDNTPEVARNASQHVQSIFFIASPLVPRQDAANLNFTNNYLEISTRNESTHSELHEKPDQGNFYVKEESMFFMLGITFDCNKNRDFSKKNLTFIFSPTQIQQQSTQMSHQNSKLLMMWTLHHHRHQARKLLQISYQWTLMIFLIILLKKIKRKRTMKHKTLSFQVISLFQKYQSVK